MDKSLIEKAKQIAQQQKVEYNSKHEQHLNDIYNEAMSLLEKQIKNGNITNGYVIVHTENCRSYSSIDKFGYCGWNKDIEVSACDGVDVAKKIRENENLKCEFKYSTWADNYFMFDFN